MLYSLLNVPFNRLIARAFRFASLSARLLLPCVSTGPTDTALWSSLISHLLNESFPAPIIENGNTLSLQFLSLLHLLPSYQSRFIFSVGLLCISCYPRHILECELLRTRFFFCLFHLLLYFQNPEQCPTHSKCPTSMYRGSGQAHESGPTGCRSRHRSGGR